MVNLLLANGCSWTAGNGIEKDKNFLQNNGTEFYTWPSVLSRKLGYECVNLGVGGGSNKRILRTTVDFLLTYPKDKYKDLLVVIGWTTPDRDEIYLDNKWYCYNAGQVFSDQNPPLSKQLIEDLDIYQKFYVTNIYDQKIELRHYFHQKYLLSNLLENLKIRHLFFNSLPPMWGPSREEQLEYDKNMKNIVTINMIQEMTFNEFIYKNDIMFSDCKHPMIDGHQLWATYLHNRLLEIYGNI